jgi:hypothetical protein
VVYLTDSEDSAVAITREGRPVAVMLGVPGMTRWRGWTMSHKRKLREILDAAREQIKAGESLSHEDFWKQVEAENAERREPEQPTPEARGRKPRKS